MKKEVARREIESLDYYLQNHTNDYGEESHTAMMMAISALSKNKGEWIPVYGKNGKTIMSYKCSKCNFHPKHAIITDFCGGCGADMRGEK